MSQGVCMLMHLFLTANLAVTCFSKTGYLKSHKIPHTISLAETVLTPPSFAAILAKT